MISIKSSIGFLLVGMVSCFLFCANVSAIGEDAYQPWKWGTDITVASGSMQGGISITTDLNGNMYAARCTTYNAITGNAIDIYRSTDLGQSWQSFVFFHNSENATYSYPQLLTCIKGDSSFLYVFSLQSDQNGAITLHKFDLSGAFLSQVTVVTGGVTDTSISYYSVCSNLEGDSIALIYETNGQTDPTPDVNLIRSLDYGNTWSVGPLVFDDGHEPDIAYSTDQQLLVVACATDPQFDVDVRRSTDFGASWLTPIALTGDISEDVLPKIAAEHDSLVSGTTVWVLYHHYTDTGNIDLRYAYSTDGGSNWVTDQVLAESEGSYEIAGEVITPDHCMNWPYAYACYLFYNYDTANLMETSEIYATYVSADSASNWEELTLMNNSLAAYSFDSRKVCQLTTYPFESGFVPGILYDGKTSLDSDFVDLYFDGYTYTDVRDEETQTNMPVNFSLAYNYPNPFNPETRIDYSLLKALHVKLEIFNILGQKIKTIVDEDQTIGDKEVIWDGTNENGEQVASGVYFYRLQAKDFVQARKMVLMK
jgi:hypothetical protein